MGATLIVDDPVLVPALPGTHLPTSEGWKAESALRHKESSISMLYISDLMILTSPRIEPGSLVWQRSRLPTTLQALY